MDVPSWPFKAQNPIQKLKIEFKILSTLYNFYKVTKEESLEK